MSRNQLVARWSSCKKNYKINRPVVTGRDLATGAMPTIDHHNANAVKSPGDHHGGMGNTLFFDGGVRPVDYR